MKKAGPVILVIVLILVVLFGIGQFFVAPVTPIAPTTPPSPAPSTPQNPPTQVIAYVPPAPTTSTPVRQGSCWTNSIAAPYRADAWRCTIGNAIQDPCFKIPNGKNFLCGVNPARSESTSTFVLKLTKPLPVAQPLPGTPPADWAWLVELAGGTLCSPFTGTLPSAEVSYGCAPGPLGSDTYIFNDFDTSTTAWVATVGTLGVSTSGPPGIATSEQVPVAAIWQ